jgi:hypothetical protein
MDVSTNKRVDEQTCRRTSNKSNGRVDEQTLQSTRTNPSQKLSDTAPPEEENQRGGRGGEWGGGWRERERELGLGPGQ